jgi:hypothetical protein
LIVIVLAPDVAALKDIQTRLSATGASKLIAEVPNIVIPRSMAEVMVFSDQVKPIAPFLKDISKVFAALFEVELTKLPTT